MAKNTNLRLSNRPADAWHFPLRALLAILLVSCVGAALLAGSSLRERPGDQPGFLAEALGSSVDAPPERHTSAGHSVSLPRSGYAVEAAGERVSLSSADPAGTAWHQFEGGATRSTPFGTETVVVDGEVVEQFLTVTERTGQKTWRWKLETGTLKPHLRSDGSVLVSAGNAVAGFHVLPAAILDRDGRDVSPADIGWRLERRSGSWWLALDLDDGGLPIPYVIDPAITYRAPSTTVGSGTAVAITKPAGTVVNDLLVAQIAFESGSSITVTPPSGWTLVNRRDASTDVGQAVYRKAAGGAEPASYTFTLSQSKKYAGGMLAYYGVNNPSPLTGTATGANGSGSAAAAATLTTGFADSRVIAFFTNKKNSTWTPPTGMTERYDTPNNADGMPSLSAADVTQAAVGATGAKTATSSDAEIWVAQLLALRVDATAPSAGTITVSESNAATYASGATLWYRPAGAGGTFTVAATATDAQSGVQKVTFPGLAGGMTPTTSTDDLTSAYQQVYTWTTGASDSGSKTVTAMDNAGNTATGTFTVTPDSVGPTGGALTVNGTAGSGGGSQSYDADGAFTITRTDYSADAASGFVSSVLTRENGTLAADACSAYGAPTTLVGAPAQSGLATGCYRFTLTGTDRVGNTSVLTSVVKVDTSAPGAPSLTLANTSADVHTTGATAYYRPAGSGSFDVTASATDAHSGILDYAFPALSGFTTSGSGATRTFTLATPTEPNGAKSVTARNPALLVSAAGTFTLTSDAGAPTGGALTVNGAVASGGGSSSYDTDGSFTIGLRTDWTDAVSGIGASTLTRESGTLAGDTCSAYGAPATLIGTPAQSGLATGCYRYTLTGTDNVGNTVSISTVVKVDTSDPSSPALTLGDGSADVHTTGATAFYRPAGSGSFDVTAASTDADSGLASYSFPSLAGFSASGSGDTRTYTLATPTEPDGAKTVTAQNGAGRTSGSTFTLTADTAAPSGGTVTANGGGTYDTDGTVALTKVDFGDGAGSGVAAQTFTRETATLAGDACGSFSGSTAVTISGGNDSDTLVTGCYRYTLAATDRVGNQASVQGTVVKVDTSAPSAPSLAISNLSGNTYYPGSGTVVWFRPLGAGQFDLTASSSDAHTAVAGYVFPALGSGWTPSGSGATKTYAYSSGAANPGAQAVTATNGAGTSSAPTAFTVSADGTAPAGGALTVNGTGATAGETTSHDADSSFAIDTRTDWTDAGAGLASSTLVRETATLASGVCGTFGSPVTLVGTPAQNGLPDGCYRYTLTGTDQLGNQSSVATVVRVDATAPGSSLDAASTYSGTAITLTYTANDGGSGLAEVELWAKGPSDVAYALVATDTSPASPSFSYTAAQGDGTYLFYTRARDAAGSTETAPGAADTQTVVDTTKPASSANALPASSSDPSLTIGYAASDATSGVDDVELWAKGPSDVAYALVATDASPASPSFSYTAAQGDGTYLFYTRARDAAGNVEDAPGTADTQTTLDGEVPTDPALSFGTFTNASATGTTVYIREGVAGGFTVTSDSDSQSGIDHHTFPALGGAWTGGGNIAGDPASAPYTFTAGDSASAGPHVVTATNGAGSTNAGTSSFTIVADTTAPVSSILCGGVGCPAGWITGVPVSVTLSAVDGASGFQEIRYTTDGSDPTPINGTVYLSAFDVSVTTTVRYRAYDRVGNAETIRSQTIQIDTSAPTAPAFTLDETDPDSHVTGTTLFYNPSGARSGTFAVTGTSGDGQSGIDKLAFPALAGATGGGDDTSSPYVGSYSWDSSTTASGAQTVTSHNNAGLTSSSTFTMTADTTAPSVSIACNGAACSAGWYTASPVSVSLTANDAGAGLLELRYTTDGSDPLTGTVYTGAFNVVATATVRIAAIDAVGNAATPASTTIQIDTSTPTATMTDPGANLRATVALGSTSADPQSGVATVTYQRSPAGAGTWTNTAASWDTTLVADGLYDLRVVVVNGAGLSTTSATVANRRVDNTLPTATMTNPGGGNHEGTITLAASATDPSGSGVANVAIQYSPAGDNTWTTVGTDTTSPYSASWDTTTVADGRYDLRAISTDNAGNQKTSNVLGNVKVANNPPIVTITSPQAFVNAAAPGTYTVTADGWGATGTDPRHIEFFRCTDASLSCSSGSWVSLGLDDEEPFTASWTQSSEPEGNRSLKATVQDITSIENSDVNNVTIDRIAPSGQSASLTAGPWYSTASVGLTLDNGTDGGSGIDATSKVVERQNAALADGSCGSFGGWSAAANPDTSVLTATCYRYRLTISDLAGNASAASGPSAAAKVDTSAPGAPALAFSALTNASTTGSTVYVRAGAAGGFTVSATATDAESGISSYSYPALGSGWTESTGAYTFTLGAADPAEPLNATATNPAGLTSAPTAFTVTPDGTAPVSSIACSGGCAPWHSAAPVTVTLSAGDGGSGVGQILYSTDGSAPSTVYAGPFTVSAQGTTTVRFAATDAVGNAETAQSQTVRIDATAPTAPALVFSAFSNAVATGTDVFYNPALAGGFTLTPSSTDGESGVSSYSLPALGSGWSESAGAYTFAAAAADPVEPFSVTATNGSGLTSAGTQFTVDADPTAPATTATCNAAACSAGWYTSSPVSVVLVASDSGAGVDQIRYTTDGSNPTILTGSAYVSAIDVASEGTTTVKFRAFDRVGNTEAVQSIQVRLDTIDPQTTIDTGPSGSLSDTSAVFTFSSDEAGSTFECRLNAGAFAACSSGASYSGLVDGSHTFQVRAVDPALRTDATPASRTWTVDTVAADTTITIAPAASTNSTSASFSFTASDAGPSFECKLDAGAFSACTSPEAYSSLAEGSHTFSVRAIDAAANRDATPAAHTWTVDTTAPDTSIVSAPSDPSASTTPTFSFGSTESPATYEVNLDAAGWVAAATPMTISPALADGSHTLQVRTTDAAGNTDASAASLMWVVDATAPTGSLTAPADGANLSGSAVTVSSNSADALSGVLNALFERSPAGAGTWTAIGAADTSTPYSVSWDTTALTDGDYDLRVTTRDIAGNQLVSATRTVTVDNTAPTLSVSVPDPVNLATPDPASITATATDTGTGIASVNFEQCSETSAACTSDTWTALGLDTTDPYGVSWALPSDGTRLIRVRATDAAGRQTTELVLANIDRTQPTGTLTAPAAGANLRGATVALTATASDTAPGTVNTVTFQRSPAGAGTWTDVGTDPAVPFTATLDTTGLADGLYDLRVFTTDSAGNAEVAPATIQVRVDNTLPTGSVTSPAAAANVRGTIALTGNSADAGSGVDTVQFQRSPAGAGTWTNQAPSWNTALVADGQYDLRITTTDNAGNTFTSAAVTVRVDNTLPTGTIAEPGDGSDLRGTLTLASDSADTGSGVATVQFQRSPAGADSWTNQAASWNTSLVADGLYDLRVITTDNAGNVFTSASVNVRVDNMLPTGSVTAPASGDEFGLAPITLVSNSADAGSGVATVVFERRQAGTSDPWTPTATPWDTAGGADATDDGTYEVRVTTTDHAGNSFSSTAITVLVDHTAPSTTASLAPGSPSNAPVTVSFSAGDGSGSGVSATSYSVDGGSVLQGAAVIIGAPGDHSNDGSHVVEFFSTDQVGNVEATKTVTVAIDTTAPSGTAGDPGDYLRGIANLTYSSAASDVSSVQFQFSPAGAGSWSNIGGADIAPPYEASWNTGLVADGPYDLRAVVTDSTGNVANELLPGLPKTVDNAAPSGSVTSPAASAYVSGSVDVDASATDGAVPPASGVSAVRFEVKPNGAGAFTVFGTQTAPIVGSTYRQALATAPLADGPADLRVVVTDVAGNETTSATRTVIVDNLAPTVTLNDPGAAVSGTVTLGVSTSGDTASVVFERSPAGAGSWTTIDTDVTPGDGFTADLATAPLADGLYDLRARATDGGGNSTTSAARTTRLDNTQPTGSITTPAVSAVVGGPAVQLTAAAADAGSGVASVAFEVKTFGSGSFAAVATDTTSPYQATWDATAAPDGATEIRAIVTDAAGNTRQTAVVTVTVDSTGPGVTLVDPGTVVSGTVALSATSAGSAARVAFGVSPAGAGTWTEIGSDTSAPFATSFDTGTVADGLYDLRAIGYDALGNASAPSVRAGVRFDNTAPRLVSSAPADGSVSASAGQIVLTASEPVTVVGVLLDGAAAPAPTISGSTLTFATGALGEGLHVFTGELEDASGTRSPFRVAVTIESTPGADRPPVELSARAAADSTLVAPGSLASVTLPPAAWPTLPSAQDFVVLRVDLSPPPPSVGPGLLPGSDLVEVTAFWGLAGTAVTEFAAPIDVVIPNSSGETVVPATSQTGASWRTLERLAGPTLPAGQRDGYYLDGTGSIHILTRHLTYFSLLRDNEAPSPPRDVVGVIGTDGLTIRWVPGTDASGQLSHVVLFVNGEPYRNFGMTEFESKLGAFSVTDTRTFTLVQVDASRNHSVPTKPLRRVPQLAGRSLEQAGAALVAAGFSVGSVREQTNALHAPGTVIDPADLRLALESSSIDLVVARAPGTAPQTRLFFSVAGSKKLALKKRTTIAVRVKVSRPARVAATLFGTKNKRLYTWQLKVKAGATVVKLRLPTQVRRPGTYTISLVARSGTQTVRRSIKIKLVGTKLALVQPKKRVLEVVLAGERPAQDALRPRRGVRVLAGANPDQTFALVAAAWRNIGVVVVDVDAYGVLFVGDLHTVFPALRLIAIAREPAVRRRSIQVGAVLALPRSTSPQQLANAIVRVAGR